MRKKQMKQMAEWCADVAQESMPNLYFGEMFETLHKLTQNINEGVGLRWFDANDKLAPLIGKVSGELLACVHYDEATDKSTTIVNLVIGNKSIVVERDDYLAYPDGWKH